LSLFRFFPFRFDFLLLSLPFFSRIESKLDTSSSLHNGDVSALQITNTTSIEKMTKGINELAHLFSTDYTIHMILSYYASDVRLIE
jgi:hypothetical protein